MRSYTSQKSLDFKLNFNGENFSSTLKNIGLLTPFRNHLLSITCIYWMHLNSTHTNTNKLTLKVKHIFKWSEVKRWWPSLLNSINAVIRVYRV